MGLSDKLKKLRIARNLAQEKVARESGIALSYYRSLEKGRYSNPTLDILTKLSNVLKVSLDELAGRELPRSKKKST
jgi:XRE family transcriptional regulator of biofilm formation